MSSLSIQQITSSTITPFTPQEEAQVQQMVASAQVDEHLQTDREELETRYQKLILELEENNKHLKTQNTLLQGEQAALMQQIALLEQTIPEREEALTQLESLLPAQIKTTQLEADAFRNRNNQIYY